MQAAQLDPVICNLSTVSIQRLQEKLYIRASQHIIKPRQNHSPQASQYWALFPVSGRVHYIGHSTHELLND